MRADAMERRAEAVGEENDAGDHRQVEVRIGIARDLRALKCRSTARDACGRLRGEAAREQVRGTLRIRARQREVVGLVRADGRGDPSAATSATVQSTPARRRWALD